MISCRIFENAVHRVSRSCAYITEDNISLQTFETTRLVAGFTSAGFLWRMQHGI